MIIGFLRVFASSQSHFLCKVIQQLAADLWGFERLRGFQDKVVHWTQLSCAQGPGISSNAQCTCVECHRVSR